MAYGTQPTGFVRKPLPDILADIEAKAREVFGAGVIQTPQSPLGQLNGMIASLATTVWEIAEDTYQSYDPDQAEGRRLEQLGRIRLLERMTDEADPSYRAAITNQDRARIDLADIARAASSVDGVTYVRVFANSSGMQDVDGLPGHAIAVSVIGGDDETIARSIRPYIVPGIDSYGNARADVEIDGYCRTIHFVRPVPVLLGLRLSVLTRPDRLGCPAPSAAAIGLAAYSALTADTTRPVNGQDITLHVLRNAVSNTYPNVEVVSVQITLISDDTLHNAPYPIGFFEIAQFDPARITVDPI